MSEIQLFKIVAVETGKIIGFSVSHNSAEELCLEVDNYQGKHVANTSYDDSDRNEWMCWVAERRRPVVSRHEKVFPANPFFTEPGGPDQFTIAGEN